MGNQDFMIKYDEIVADQKELKSKYDLSQENIGALNQKYNKIKQQYDEILDNSEKDKTSLNEMDIRLKQYESEKTKMEQAFTDLQTKYVAMSGDKQQQIESLENEVNSTNDRYDKLQNDANSLQSKYDQMSKTLDEKNKIIEGHQSILDEYDEQSKQELASKETMIESLQNEIHDKAQQNIDAVNAKYNQLMEESEKNKAASVEMGEKMDAMNIEKKSIDKELEKHITENSKYKETINDLQTKYDSICDINTKLQHDYDKFKELEIKYKDLQTQNNETLNALNLEKENNEKQMEQEMKYQKYKELELKYQTLLNDIDMND